MRKILPLLLLALALPAARAESDVDAVRRADDARVAATLAGDGARLDAAFSNDLVYAHSTGLVNHKADFIQMLTGHDIQYLTMTYETRQFEAAAPGVVLMRGRLRAHTLNHGRKSDVHLSFLGVYRREHGVWRFLAWQSSALTDASPPWPR